MNDIYLFAKHYRTLGLNVTCASSIVTEHNFYCKTRLKAPNHKYSHLFMDKQTEEEFENYDWEHATGVGFTSGYKNFCTIDIDGCNSVEILHQVLNDLELPLNYEWVIQSGGQNGFHVIVYMKKEIRIWGYEEKDVITYTPLRKYKYLFEKIELLWKANSILPPSIHPSSNVYRFLNTNIPKQLPQHIDPYKLAFFIERYFEGEGVFGPSYSSQVPDAAELMHSDLTNIDLSKHKDSDLFLVIDTETDGLIKDSDVGSVYPNIIQIAWIVMNKAGGILKKESKLINSGLTENLAQHINNISLDMIRKIGVSPYEAYRDLLEDIFYVKYIVAHNVSFDIPIIENELSKYGLHNILKSKLKICTMQSSLDLCKLPGGRPYRYPKLSELFNYLFKTNLNQLHNAESDVMATAMCFRKMATNKMLHVTDRAKM